jgi:rRNA maturation protein Rpf1
LASAELYDPASGFAQLQPQLASERLSRILKDMEVHFTPEQEVQLAQIATKAGTDPEHLVKDAVLRLLEDEIRSRPVVPELPVWRLGVIGSLHRRDIYNDVR